MDVQNKCIDSRDWKKEVCTVSDSKVTESWYDYTAETGFIDASLSSITGAILEVTDLLPTSDAGKAQREVISNLKPALFGLNSCQKACLVKCASSVIIKYTNNSKGKPSNDYKYVPETSLYCNRKGVCTEFSRLADDIGSYVGVPIRMTGGSGHAYNSFKIDGEWYIGEPQNSTCKFFHTSSTLKKYRQIKSKSEKIYDGSARKIKGYTIPSGRKPKGSTSR